MTTATTTHTTSILLEIADLDRYFKAGEVPPTAFGPNRPIMARRIVAYIQLHLSEHDGLMAALLPIGNAYEVRQRARRLAIQHLHDAYYEHEYLRWQ